MKCFKILMMFYVVIGVVKILNNPVHTDISVVKTSAPFTHISHKL